MHADKPGVPRRGEHPLDGVDRLHRGAPPHPQAARRPRRATTSSHARSTRARSTSSRGSIPTAPSVGSNERRFIRSSVRPYPRDEPDDGLRSRTSTATAVCSTCASRIRTARGGRTPTSRRLLVRRDPVDGPEDGAVLPPARRRADPELRRRHDQDAAAARGPRPQPQLPGGVGARSTSSAAPVRTRPRSPRCARWCRPSPTGRTSPATSRTTRSAACTSARTRATPDDDFPTHDLRAYKIIGERGTELTGYPAVSVFHDFKYDPKQTIKGGAHDWMYDHLGVYSWTTEFWSPQRQAGLSDYHFTDWVREHPVEDDLTLIAVGDEELDPEPTSTGTSSTTRSSARSSSAAGTSSTTGSTCPSTGLEQEVAPHSDWALFHALISPLLEVRRSTSSSSATSSFLVRLVLQNAGWLPTNVTREGARAKGRARPRGGARAAGRRARSSAAR